jgi:magnesium transporter
VPIAELIDEDRRRVSVLDDQERGRADVRQVQSGRGPVVDTTNRLVGVITIDDVVDVIEEGPTRI